MGNREALDTLELSMKNRLRVLRAERDLSQAELANLAGVSRQTINSIETSKYDPSLPLAFKLAGIFNLTIQDVFIPNRIETED